MKKQFKLIAAALLIAALAFTGCAKDSGDANTPAPTAQAEVVPTGEGMFGMITVDPAGTAAPRSTPDAGQSAEPSETGEPGGRTGSIEGFMTGKVVDPSEIPDIVETLGKQFPEHTVQSVTEDLYDGNEAYRVTLQGEGELARTVFVFADGSILIPTEGD